MSSENPSGGGANFAILAIVVGACALSITFFLMGGGFSRHELWSDASAAELATFDRANATEVAATAAQSDNQEASRDPEHPLEVSGD